ncbi:MAG: hypothetical protein KDJ44_21690 [Rhodoblastus sp.]|nr:hypothetical protein [Rhodoblastus sp.]
MSPFERDLALALEGVSFLPGSKDKRFARDMAARAKTEPDRALTESQAANLRRLGRKYRRQIPRRLHHEETPA